MYAVQWRRKTKDDTKQNISGKATNQKAVLNFTSILSYVFLVPYLNSAKEQLNLTYAILL
jgi:hypothetical protein